MKDALGNDIIIGNTYGFSRNKNGVNIIKLGVVTERTPTGFASLKINQSFSSVYNIQPELDKNQHYEKVKIKPFMLFPI